jgi:hypothetical protein
MAKLLPELKFRHYLEPRLAGQWLMTWHEDREISPGVPDLHYVMIDEPHSFRVGWLELKATDLPLSKSNRIGVEPSQHQYIRRWCPHMPIHFMVCVIEHVFLVPGHLHKHLSGVDSEFDLRLISELDFHRSEIAIALPPYLKKVTQI